MDHEEEIISLQNITKSYKLYRSRNERLKDWVLPLSEKRYIDHFALKNVSFSIKKGEVIGLIGKNGSGKSTLLKILAGVVTPTSGNMICLGNVTALLELGAGFNPELTGIENIFYLGAIQGIPRSAMENKVNEILAFAEIGEYAWQPVKNYSSGMYIRLAFSLSVHVDPEILIIDEALSVGDVRFQQKCFRKIRQFKDQEKTIIFCSHNMQAVRDFCTKVVWIHEGEVRAIGEPEKITEHYNLFMTTGNQESIHKPSADPLQNRSSNLPIPEELKHFPWVEISITEQIGQKKARIEGISITDEHLNLLSFIQAGRDVIVSILVQPSVLLTTCEVQISLHNPLGSKIAQISSHLYGKTMPLTPDKLHYIQCRFRLPDLPNGLYSFGVGLRSFQMDVWEMQHFVHDVLFFTLQTEDARFHSNGTLIIKEVEISHQDMFHVF